MDAIGYLLLPFQEPFLIVLVAIGLLAGMYVGAIPGLSGTMAVSLLVSFTFGWETNTCLIARNSLSSIVKNLSDWFKKQIR